MKLSAWLTKQLAVGLAIGLIVGVPVGRRITKGQFRHRLHEGAMHGHMGDRMVKRFSQELRLTPEQQVQVERIFDARHEQMLALRKEMFPKFEQLRSATFTEIRGILRPDQQQRFEALEVKFQAKTRRFREGIENPSP